MYAFSSFVSRMKLVELEFVKHIRRVLRAALTSGMHLTRIITLHATLLVTPKCITRQVRVLVLEILLSTIRLLSRICLYQQSAIALHETQNAKHKHKHEHTRTRAQTKSNGNPYRRTVSTNTLKTKM